MKRDVFFGVKNSGPKQKSEILPCEAQWNPHTNLPFAPAHSFFAILHEKGENPKSSKSDILLTKNTILLASSVESPASSSMYLEAMSRASVWNILMDICAKKTRYFQKYARRKKNFLNTQNKKANGKIIKGISVTFLCPIGFFIFKASFLAYFNIYYVNFPLSITYNSF